MIYYKKKKSSLTESNAYSACLRKLNYRDYSYGELREFLAEQEELGLEFICELLNDFVEYGYINEKRFAESLYSSWLHNSLRGKYYLINKLKNHKINEDVISEYQELDLAELELERASLLLQKYSIARGICIAENRMKAAMYLKNQYYAPSIINKAINKIIDISK